MGRLIDADYLLNLVNTQRSGDKIDNLLVGLVEDVVNMIPTVEAIPKDQYEARLKADLIAMLTEIQLEFEENTVRWYVGRVDGKSDDVVLMETINELIQQKINALKEQTDD